MNRKDKIKGMVYFSLYADALGFPHEFNFDPNRQVKLQTKSQFLTVSECLDPWACWADYDQIPNHLSGILSDDSFYKLKIQIPFLQKYSHYTDELFAKYCLDILDEPCMPAMNDQLVDWLYMFDQIQLPEDLKTDIKAKIENRKQTQGFYDQNTSACFGLFLFHWQAITEHRSATKFDSPEGNRITQIFFDHLQHAFGGENTEIHERLKDYSLGYYNQAQEFTEHADVTNFSGLRSQLYEFRKQLPDEIISLKHDPLEFIICISIAELLFPDEPLHGLKLVCSSGGDTDTIGSIWGSILGANLGYEYLIKTYPSIENDFIQIETFLQSQSISLSNSIDTLISIATPAQDP